MITYGARLRTRANNRRLLASALVFIVIWEAIAQILLVQLPARADKILPSLWHVGQGFIGLSDYWQGGFGLEETQFGGDKTYLGAVLALIDNSAQTAARLVLGLVLAIVFGIGGGLIIGYSGAIRRFLYSPINFIALIPVFALLPLYAFWFGVGTAGAVAFISISATVGLLRFTVHAVDNVPLMYLQSAQTLGASGLALYRTVILPAIVPELRGGLLFILTFSWTIALGGELLGIQSGLGQMMWQAIRFSQIDRMVLIGGVFVILAATSVVAYTYCADRLIRWTE